MLDWFGTRIRVTGRNRQSVATVSEIIRKGLGFMIDISKYNYKVSAAGRVNLIGEHVDYCGGKVMPCALSLKNTVYIRPNGTNRINIRWTDLPDEVSLDIEELDSYRNLKYAKYHAGCAYLWKNAGHKIIGCDLLCDCTVPFGSGLSSSAAIEVSTIAALAVAAGEAVDRVEIALVAQKAEQEYAGVNCGIMDQYASANGLEGHAILLDCKTLERKFIPVKLGDCALVIANCNKPHNLVESKYNERRKEVENALKILQKHFPISCLADLKPYQLEEYKTMLPPVIHRRAKHVVEECDRVQKAAEAMEKGNMAAFGKILNESHESLEKLYEVTGKELDSLAHAAQSHHACLGSRMTGAGFGGCTVSLVKKEYEEDFKQYVTQKYYKETGYKPTFYPAELSDGIIIERI